MAYIVHDPPFLPFPSPPPPLPLFPPLCIYEQYTVSLPVLGEVYDHPNSCAEKGTGNAAHSYTIHT